MRKEERNSNSALKLITQVKCNVLYYRVSLSYANSKESPVCQQAFQNIYGILERSWGSLKKAAIGSDPGPIMHGNTNKRNRHRGSIIASTRSDVIDFLTELGKQEGESYATRFIRERTSVGLRNEEEGCVDLPSFFSKRKLYERYVFVFPYFLNLSLSF